MNARRRSLLLLIVVCMLLADLSLVSAQGPVPPVDPGGSWSEVINPDGSLKSDSLTDGGVITQQAEWMPEIPFIGPIPAEYHVYYTPSGNSVVLPGAATLFFMAANAAESGYLDAASTLGTSGLTVASSDSGSQVGFASLGAYFGALLGNQEIGLPGHVSTADFFDRVVSGQENIWSLGPVGLMSFLTSLSQTSILDGNLYSYMLLYTPGQCASVPGGCTASQLALLATSVPPIVPTPGTPPPDDCPPASVQPGAISASASKIGPPYPLVVGQDPNRRGVDVAFSASVAPTLYTYYTSEPVYEKCTVKPCGRKKIIGYTCEQHTQTFTECIASASASISLSRASREWILDILSIQYPEAYLHQPSFPITGAGCAWSAARNQLPVADPGNWNMTFSGRTSGTPVSAPREFSRTAMFSVWLKQVRIIQ